MPARLWGRDFSGLGLGLGRPSSWAWASESRAEGRLALAFHSLSLGKPARLWTRRRESGGLRLFLSHCSLARKEMTAGVSHPGAALHPGFGTPALPWSCRPAGQFQGQVLTPLHLGHASFPGSVLPLISFPLHLLYIVPPSSHSQED